MPRLTPQQRSLRAKLAAHEKWASTDPVVGTAAARAAGPGSLDYWLNKVDPDHLLDDAERARRAESAKKAHYARLAFRSAQARARQGRSADAA
jgi:hypothetical protein